MDSSCCRWMNFNKIWGFFVFILWLAFDNSLAMNTDEKRRLKEKAVEMTYHAYNHYKRYAYPADELMPLSCKGRYRGSEPSRGDVDDSLGNFSLTMIDSLDTLAVIGDIHEFETAVQLILRDVTFDTDVIVSVFETNIRVLGGLLSGHALATYFRQQGLGLSWYNTHLLTLAADLGDRLLPAFDTKTGIPYSRVNLRHGNCAVQECGSGTRQPDTCTACGGTMILEFAALSRYTGLPKYERAAQRAMEYLWAQRNRGSDLMGTVINVHSGDWVRREAGVGAGIDSYYEYVLKAYILLGQEEYLSRFQRHYKAVRRYLSKGPLLLNVHMHRPLQQSRHFMDALQAFWPGLQVLQGDLAPAIETHALLHSVVQRHRFLPEAFTHDLHVHWAQHPLRPEFIESTFFLYRATQDPHYLEVGREALENLEQYARVPCGFAALRDVTTAQHEDQMDSFLLAETFKYLYLLFAEDEEMVVPIDDYVFTTEAHLIPLKLSLIQSTNATNSSGERNLSEEERWCPVPKQTSRSRWGENYATQIRQRLQEQMKSGVTNPAPPQSACESRATIFRPTLTATDFDAANPEHIRQLGEMGVRLISMADGKLQLVHSAGEAASAAHAEAGFQFMKELIELSQKQSQQAVGVQKRIVQLLSEPFLGSVSLAAGPAQFGPDLTGNGPVSGELVSVQPISACSSLEEPELVRGKVALVRRGDCMFVEKARVIQEAGGIAGIVYDNTNPDGSGQSDQLFSMSGDAVDDVSIPLVFVLKKEGDQLQKALELHSFVKVALNEQPLVADELDSHLDKKEGGDETIASNSNLQKNKHNEASTSVEPAVTGTDEPAGPDIPLVDSVISPEPPVSGAGRARAADTSEVTFHLLSKMIADSLINKILRISDKTDGEHKYSREEIESMLEDDTSLSQLYTKLANQVKAGALDDVGPQTKHRLLNALSRLWQAAHKDFELMPSLRDVLHELCQILGMEKHPDSELIRTVPRISLAEIKPGEESGKQDFVLKKELLRLNSHALVSGVGAAWQVLCLRRHLETLLSTAPGALITTRKMRLFVQTYLSAARHMSAGTKLHDVSSQALQIDAHTDVQLEENREEKQTGANDFVAEAPETPAHSPVGERKLYRSSQHSERKGANNEDEGYIFQGENGADEKRGPERGQRGVVKSSKNAGEEEESSVKTAQRGERGRRKPLQREVKSDEKRLMSEPEPTAKKIVGVVKEERDVEVSEEPADALTAEQVSHDEILPHVDKQVEPLRKTVSVRLSSSLLRPQAEAETLEEVKDEL